MQVNPYLFFNGQCEEAFQFYEKCLGAKIEAMHRFESSPMAQQSPAGWGKKIMHATLKLSDGTTLLGCDAPPGRYEAPQGFSICLTVKGAPETERVFHELAEAGNVTMPVQETFWSPRFGMVVDRFGIPWMVNCEPTAAQAGA